MSWFRSDPPRTADDPVFGRLTFARGADWEGQVASPARGEMVSVAITRPDGPPTAEDRRRFQDFADSYDRIVPSIRAEVFKLLQPYLELPGWDGPAPASAEELWPLVQLELINIEAGRPLELMFAFRDDDTWPGAMFNLEVDGLDVRAVSLDD